MMNSIPQSWVEQEDCPGEVSDYEEEQELLKALFAKPVYSLPMIKAVMRQGHLTFRQLLDRYEDSLVGVLSQEAQDMLNVLYDGTYLAQVWSWIVDKQEYKQWVSLYLENKDRLTQIADYYQTHPDYDFDLHRSALEAKNELYLAQTMPGEPADLDFDPYTGDFEVFDNIYLSAPPLQGDADYDRLLFEDDEILFDDRSITSVPILQADAMELKPVDYLSLRRSDVGKRLSELRQVAIGYRKENFRLRRHWKHLGLPSPPKYLDEAALENKMKLEHREELAAITSGLNILAKEGKAPQDILLLLMDGTFFDFISCDVFLPANAYAAMTLQQFGLLFADEVLDYAHPIQDPPGWHRSSEVYYAYLLDKNNPMDSVRYDESKLEWSRLFNEVVLDKILCGDGVKQAYKQAHHAVKMSQSPAGQRAYRQAVASGKSYGQAMHDFYEAAYNTGDLSRPRDRVIAVHPDKMVVLTASSQYADLRTFNWNIARIKASNNELYIPADAAMPLKKQLYHAARSLCWKSNLINSMKE